MVGGGIVIHVQGITCIPIKKPIRLVSAVQLGFLLIQIRRTDVFPVRLVQPDGPIRMFANCVLAVSFQITKQDFNVLIALLVRQHRNLDQQLVFETVLGFSFQTQQIPH